LIQRQAGAVFSKSKLSFLTSQKLLPGALAGFPEAKINDDGFGHGGTAPGHGDFEVLLQRDGGIMFDFA
jgi:hypothetical protein